MKKVGVKKLNHYLSLASDAVKVFSSMALVFLMLVITGPLAYGVQSLERMF